LFRSSSIPLREVYIIVPMREHTIRRLIKEFEVTGSVTNRTTPIRQRSARFQ